VTACIRWRVAVGIGDIEEILPESKDGSGNSTDI
jgi:hypothetical protein